MHVINLQKEAGRLGRRRLEQQRAVVCGVYTVAVTLGSAGFIRSVQILQHAVYCKSLQATLQGQAGVQSQIYIFIRWCALDEQRTSNLPNKLDQVQMAAVSLGSSASLLSGRVPAAYTARYMPTKPLNCSSSRLVHRQKIGGMAPHLVPEAPCPGLMTMILHLFHWVASRLKRLKGRPYPCKLVMPAGL